MPDAPRCTARSKRSGKQCRKHGLHRPDGSRTQHCRNHGGVNERLPKGDPGRGGRPPTSFTYVEIIPEDVRPIYELARKELGKLEHEISLARTNLYRFQRRHEEQQKGGIPTSVSSGGTGVSVRPYADIVGEYLDRIARLEERRARIQRLDDPTPTAPRGGSGAGPMDDDPKAAAADARARLQAALLRDVGEE